MEKNYIKSIINGLLNFKHYTLQEFQIKDNNKCFWGICNNSKTQKKYAIFLTEENFKNVDADKISIDSVIVLVTSKSKKVFSLNMIPENFRNNMVVVTKEENIVLYYSENTVKLATEIQYILNEFKKIKLHKKTIFSYKLTSALIVINIFLYVVAAILSKNIIDNDIRVLLFLGAKENTLISSGQYYRLITCMFLHGGIMHLAFNMYSLGVLGPIIEKSYGKLKYIIIYLVGGIISSFSSYIFSESVSVGASGAIFSLLGALLVLTIKMRNIAGKDIIRNVVSVIIVNIFIGLTMPNIDNYAHIGGLIGGVFLSIILNARGNIK